MAISAEYLKLSQSNRVPEPALSAFLEYLIEEGAIYVPQALSLPQFATLHAVLKRFIRQPQSSPTSLAAELDTILASDSAAAPASGSRTCPLGLDELDILARTRAGYAFTELTPELQDAMLDLIATGDLATKELNLSLWLEELRSSAAHTPTVF